MLFKAVERRLAINGLIEVTTEVLLDFASNFDMLGGDERKLYPLWEDEIIGDPKSEVVDALSSLLCSFLRLLQRQDLSYSPLKYVIIQVNSENLAPKADLFSFVPLSYCS